jgi:predicted cupin superfamily sugar epimerase
LEQGNFSAFHKIKSDECWHFYAGQTLLVYVINTEGKLDIIKLGSDIENGEVFQYVVPANCWFASIPASHAEFCFVGCTVSPGFDFNDFELAKAEDLINEFPNLSEEIKKLCRQ